MPKIILHYFAVKGIGEGIRLLLAYGGEDFEDHRVTYDEWPRFKASTPMGQMPVLDIDGKIYTQSSAIAKYLGKKYGLGGEDIEEDFEIDEVLEFLGDIRSRAVMVHHEPDAEVKARKHEIFSRDFYPMALEKLNQTIIKNNGHLTLKKLTWVDFVFAGIFDYLKVMLRMPELEVKYPSYKRLVDNVYGIPQVKSWCDRSPKYDYNF